MKLWTTLLVGVFVVVSSAGRASSTAGVTYFVDDTNGSDSQSGTSTTEAWQHISKVNSSSFAPGDSILFKRGGVWREQLVVPSSGTERNPITFGAYGTGALPVINGAKIITGWVQEALSPVLVGSLPETGSDDGYLNSKDFNNTAQWIYAGVYSASPTASYIRFPDITLPKGGIINSAWITLKACGSDDVKGVTTTIRAIAVGNAAAPTSAADGNEKTLTDTSVRWETPDNWANQSAIRTPDLSRIVRALVNRTGWTSGNSIVFYLTSTNQIFTYHTICSQENGAKYAPTLSIYYTPTASPIYSVGLTTNPNLVFEDGKLLGLVSSKSEQTWGTYYYDKKTARLYVWTVDGSDPDEHLMEASNNPPNPSGADALVEIGKHDNITVDSLSIVKPNFYGVSFIGSHNITIRNSNFEYSYRDVITSSEDPAAPNPSNIFVLNNTFTNNGIWISRGGFESTAVNIVGWQTAIIHGNSIKYQLTQGIQFLSGPKDIEISNNLFIGNRGPAIYLSAGYVKGGDTKNITIKNNKAVGCGGFAQYEIALETRDSVDGVHFYNNIADGTGAPKGAGLLFGYVVTTGGAIKNVSVYNNTFYNTLTGIEVYGPTSDASNDFKNNLIYATGQAWVLHDPNEANYSPDYNLLYGSSPTIRWEGTSYTLAEFQSAKHKMLHSVNTDPLLANPQTADYFLQSFSPAINAGANVGLSSDYSGYAAYPYGSAPDIGALEWRP